MRKVTADIDIDFPDNSLALEELVHVRASKIENGEITKHNTGVYFQDIPLDPVTGLAIIDHETAKNYGYFKIDFLNVGVYKKIKSPQHLDDLFSKEPPWEMLEDKKKVKEMFHLGEHFDLVYKLKPRNIEQLAMVLGLRLPSKRYLIGKSWHEIAKEIWLPSKDGYYFKKPHAFSYASLIMVQMNLMAEESNELFAK